MSARPREVIASLWPPTARWTRVTDLVFQVHSMDPPQPYILRSIELMAEQVAPAFGWQPQPVETMEKVTA